MEYIALFLVAGWLMVSVVCTPAAPVPASPHPDPLVALDGTAIDNPEDWRERRRPELIRLFEEEVYGRTRLGRPEALAFEVREEKRNAREGRATRLRVGILFEGDPSGRQMELLVYLPRAATEPVPVFLGLNFDGNYTTTEEPDLPLPTHFVTGLFENKREDHRPTEAGRGIHADMWPYDLILERGYGIATACYTEVEPDTPGRWREGPRGLGPEPGAGDWGTIGAWAWAMSRALDYLETHPSVDARRVAAFGFSRLGKTTLWAGAQDERFALIVSQESGKGGASLSNRGTGEPVKHLVEELGHWFTPTYATYVDNEAALPVNAHSLLALIAPRPLLVLSGSTDDWSDPEGEFLAARAATPVYALLGLEGVEREMPVPGTRTGGTLGYYLRPGPHDVTVDDWQVTLDFADRFLQKK
jgi:hypothetical protein